MQVTKLFLCLAALASGSLAFLLIMSHSLNFTASIQVTLTHPDAWIYQPSLSPPVTQQAARNDSKMPKYSQRTISDILRSKDQKWPQFSIPTPRTAKPLARHGGGGGFLNGKFTIHQNFSFPQPRAVRPIEEITKMEWFHSLTRYLKTLPPTSQITLVTSNSLYLDILLNWLISATVRSGIPLSSILVISLDRRVHELLRRKCIASLYIPPEALVNPSASFQEPFEKVMMTRLTVIRILNHWGFDVANYDTDAIILKDPQPLYNELRGYDIVGSVGKYPYDLTAMWGITVCIGVVLIRSSERTGKKTYQLFVATLRVIKVTQINAADL